MFDLLKYKERIAVQTDRNESLTYALLHEEAGKLNLKKYNILYIYILQRNKMQIVTNS